MVFGEGMEHPIHRGETMPVGLHDRYGNAASSCIFVFINMPMNFIFCSQNLPKIKECLTYGVSNV